MSKHINHNPKRVHYDKLYLKYLEEAGKRGLFSIEDVKFWSDVNRKAKKNPAFAPFRYLYRQPYRMGIRHNQFQFKTF